MAKICVYCARRYGEESVICTDDGRPLVQVAADLSFPDGLIADRFPAIRLIGAGAMGNVYLAMHPSLRARLAIKMIRPELLGDSDAVARFRREAENAFKIDHPNVVRIHDLALTKGGELALVMDYVEGTPLTELVSDIALGVKQSHVARVCSLIWQIAAGLDAAHGIGIAHRDLKPANIMITQAREGTEVAKLVDFGLAKATHLPSQNISNDGDFVGTPEYASPEQASFAHADAHADRYALA